ncbi:MAG TPA: triose-phosphate isomerase [Actinomycetota bacterium]|jgi:triosephosphate isomerase (TIM)|nr:triose-phosphate isomerase [Actinomycetota bacterium]
MRRPLIAGNWKMHKTHLEAITLVQALGHELAEHDFEAVEVAVCPPFTSLRTVQTLIDSDRYAFALGAQNVFHEKEGAFTGEVSAPMLAALDVDYVIVGHSERREHFGEDDDAVNAKVKAAWEHGMTPIVCCGETDGERAAGETEGKVERQVTRAIAGLDAERVARGVIAYEPIWAIGTGKTATPQDAQGTIRYIREVVRALVGDAAADAVRILYGGSVKSGNTAALLSEPDVDGGLVGGASLDGAEFAAIVRAAAATRGKRA